MNIDAAGLLRMKIMAATFPFYHTVTNSAVRVTIQPGDGYSGWAQINNMSSARGAVVGGLELVAGVCPVLCCFADNMYMKCHFSRTNRNAFRTC